MEKMRRAAGATPNANGRPEDFDYLDRRVGLDKCVAPLEMP
jgi:hypothetical protein